MADPLGVNHGFAARPVDGCLLGPHALLPCIGDLSAQVQAVNAWMVGFQVGTCPGGGPAAQGCQSPSWAAFGQVVDQQVTDRLAGEVMTLDRLGECAPTRGARPMQPGRRGRAVDAGLAQQPGSGAAASLLVAPSVPTSVSSSSGNADRDVVEHAALGGQDDRCPRQRAVGSGRRCAVADIACRLRPRDPPLTFLGVPGQVGSGPGKSGGAGMAHRPLQSLWPGGCCHRHRWCADL